MWTRPKNLHKCVSPEHTFKAKLVDTTSGGGKYTLGKTCRSPFKVVQARRVEAWVEVPTSLNRARIANRQPIYNGFCWRFTMYKYLVSTHKAARYAFLSVNLTSLKHQASRETLRFPKSYR